MDGLREQDIAGAGTDGARARVAVGADGAAAVLAAGATAVSDAHKVRLFGAAYRMLGSACDADTMVEAALRRAADAGYGPGQAAGADRDAKLVAEVLGAALAALEPTRQRRDPHSGAWLPEPVLTESGALGPLETAEARESVSMARLVVLERLSPAERAAFVLREMFGYGPAESAAVLGLPEERSVVVQRRARRRVRESGARAEETGQERWLLVEELLRATTDADVDALAELLSEDVVAWSDGGGQEGVPRRPVLGAVKVGRFLAGLLAKAPEGTHGCVAEINGDAAVVATARDEVVVGVLVPEFGPQGLVGIRTVADPPRLVFLNRQWAQRAAG